MQAKENGAVVAQSSALARTPIDQTTLDESKNGKARQKFLLKKDKDSLAVGWKNSKTMMTHFRIQNNI